MRLEVLRADTAEALREGAANHIAGGGSSNNFASLSRRQSCIDTDAGFSLIFCGRDRLCVRRDRAR